MSNRTVDMLPADLTVTEDDPLLAGQFHKSHWTSSMELVSGNANFASEPILATIAESSAAVDMAARGIHLPQETHG
jgi:hypothetical protein